MANWALSFCAAWPLERANEEVELELELEPEVEAAESLADPLEEVAAVEPELAEAAPVEVEEVEEVDPEPVNPPVAPVAAILASASAVVVHVMEVPALLTKGKAAQVVPPAQAVVTNAPFTHCAKAPPTQASSPEVQDEDAERVANWAFNF